MIQGLSKTRRRLIIASIILGVLALWIYLIARVFINEENLELRSVILKACITKVESTKNGHRYALAYHYRSRDYTNVILTNEYTFTEGDSIQIRIDSKDPGAHCELAY